MGVELFSDENTICDQKCSSHVSSEQERMYILNQLDDTTTAYNISFGMKATGYLKAADLENVFKKLIQRHQVFRTSFHFNNNEIVKTVHDDVDFSIQTIDVKNDELELDCDTLLCRYKDVFIRKYDLEKPPLIRVGFICINETKHIIILDMHHIISDGYSVGIILKEMISIYNGEQLKPLDYNFESDMDFINDKKLAQYKNYWINKFKDELPILNMPTDFPRPAKQEFKGDQISFALSDVMVKKLKNVSDQLKSTLYITLFTAYNILLYRYTGQNDLIVGTSMLGRKNPKTRNLVGMYVNTVPIRTRLSGLESFDELLKQVKNTVFEAHENQAYPIGDLINELEIKRDVSRNPLFDTIFDYQNIRDINVTDLQMGDIHLERYKIRQNISKFDFMIDVMQWGEQYRFDIEYSTSLFTLEFMQRFAAHFKNILCAVSENPYIKICEIDMLDEIEKKQIMSDFNFKRDIKFKTMIELWEDTVSRYPDNIAVAYQKTEYTYKEFDHKVNQLANFIKENTDQKQICLGVLMKRGPELIRSILAIWKAGAIYIPLDLGFPEERLVKILQESKAKLLITESFNDLEKIAENISNNTEAKILSMDLYDAQINCQSEYYSDRQNNLTDIAYVIYTSGSTGNPKGAMVEHLGMTNHLDAKVKSLNISKNTKIVQNASHCFDISIWQMFAAFINGGQTVVYSNEVVMEPSEFIRAIKDDGITVLEVVPSYLSAMIPYLEQNIEAFQKIEYLLVTGEAIHTNLVNKWFELYPGIPMVNAYGPTEASDDITHHFMKQPIAGGTVPIGRPIQNCTIYILDKAQNLCPIGVPGEICVSGISVGRGYLNNPEMTNKVFTTDPFVKDYPVRMYHTGDIGKWLLDGTIEYFGRIDYQVKIRGYRIELEEIEHRLQEIPFIKKAVVVDVKEQQSNYLCAYYVADEAVNEIEIKEYLKQSLPYYMIPSYFVSLDEFPLTSNGKLDRKSLPLPIMKAVNGAQLPVNAIEEQLLSMWREILKVDNIGTTDNFFDLGGHSLKVIQLASYIHKSLQVMIPVGEIFQLPTIKELADYILKQNIDFYEPISAQPEKEYYIASPAQKRLFILNQLNPDLVDYNMCGGILAYGDLNNQKAKSVIKTLVKRHESFRTSFKLIGNELYQKINDNMEFSIQDYTLETKSEEEIINQFIRPFDLEKEPLLRVGLLKRQGNQTLVLFDMHHIISDGESIKILMQEFVHLYQGEELEEIKIQYRDYSKWYHDRLNSGKLNGQKQYWLEVFQETVPFLNLPIDYPRPKKQSHKGETLSYQISSELYHKLIRISEDTGTTLYMLLLSAYTILLYKYTSQKDIVIGTPVSGRVNVEVENIVGLFVNTIAIRNRINDDMSFHDLLNQVKGNSLKAFENQEYPFENLIDELHIERDLSHNPLFDTMFLYENREMDEIKLGEITYRSYEHRNEIAKFDLTMEVISFETGLVLNLEYCRDLFNKETINRLEHHFINILDQITLDKSIGVKNIEMLSEHEKEYLLYDLNQSETIINDKESVIELFEKQAVITPDEVAVIFNDETMTYQQLNQKANILSWHLTGLGVGENHVIAIIAERSFELIIGILGILKTGGAYAPIDCDYPQNRIDYIINDLNSDVVITQSKFRDKLLHTNKIIIDIESIIHKQDIVTTNLGRVFSPERLMYVIYTSGSTGNPKGVMVKSDAFSNLIQWFTDEFSISSKDNILLIASTSFDLAQKNIYSTLVKGGKLTLFTPGHFDYERMLEVIKKQDITILNCTPSAFNPLLDWDADYEFKKLISLRYVFLGGEVINMNKVRTWLEHANCKAQIVNTYGPTECTDIATSYRIISEDYDKNDIPIGKPIYNACLYVCNEDQQLVPEGVMGELYIGGKGVALGYHNNIDLTNQKFVENPFRTGERMYRTGDIVKWLPSGELGFVGRVDSQVKIRGYRIEIGEIESVLLKHDLVKDVVIMVKGEKENPYLCAFLCLNEDSDLEEIKRSINKVLPNYMVPSIYIVLEQMPLTPNGKVDKNKLRLQDVKKDRKNYIAPRNETQEKLAELCEEILGISPVGIEDNFFEIGGHSLKAVALANSIYKNMGIKIEVNDVFEYYTIEKLSQLIDLKYEELAFIESILLQVENL